MSQRAVETVLGRLITDGQFRAAFFEEPTEVCQAAGVDLSGTELQALLRVDEDVLRELAAGLHPRLWREQSAGESDQVRKSVGSSR